MDVVDDAEVPLDPRIQIELENLNTATDNINRLEIELDEAHTAFGQLLSESTRRLTDLVNKLGANCINRARCYYEALEVARQAQIQCQYQAQLFQRASEIHAAAKETVALAEARFMSHQHEWNFDQAWQDMLNHATIKVMDAENQKAECGREHHRRATLFHDAETKVQQLEEKYRKSIAKARPYFELKSQYDQMLATQMECVERLQKAVKDAKRSYSSSFRALEDISNQIHQQRRDYDMVANGPREPGVGAELISPENSFNYDTDLNKISISRANSLGSSTEPDAEERSKDFDDVRDLQQRVDQLGGRSIDGSESFSSQWELEVQASMEKLNNLSMKNPEWKRDADEVDDVKNRCDSENKITRDQTSEVEVSTKCLKDDQNEQRKKLPIDLELSKFTMNSTGSSIDIRQTLLQSPINSILNRSKIAIKNSLSKSLTNSPVNISFNFGKSRAQASVSPRNENIATENEIATPQQNDNRSSEKLERLQLDNNLLKDPKEFIETSKVPNLKDCGRCEDTESRKVLRNDDKKKLSKFSSRSVNSTPVRARPPLSHLAGTSLDEGKVDFVESSSFKKDPPTKTSSVRELPLLSFIGNNSIAKDKSCSMINLAEKHNLKTLLDNPELRSIQTVSADRLANARNNLMGDYTDAKTIRQ